MPAASAPLRVTPRHIQLLRAVFAAVAALMITFSPDHSHAVGLAVFGGFGIATGLVFAIAAWLVAPAGRRGGPALLAAIHLVAGMAASIVTLRSDVLFFVVVIVWALLTGLIELLLGVTARRRGEATRAARTASRDAIVVGALGLVLGVALLFVSPEYALDYVIETKEGALLPFTLTGTTIGVGLLGGYAAIVAVYLGIAGLSPEQQETDEASVAEPAATAPQEERP
ncbi:acyl-CoA synthetase [Microbacterium marinilacus]|uniref:Acyl-CoA synthetase n=1 Tax=Microbacterium marinilacus TaxID=415209 RepID=A0ABP7BUT0_9MICO|nr:acyl-CoA synthetase [Microbacterium marinilacus]MBY0689151.1 acyl-CoA synthetase [Microbacterium marinilacus]